MNDITKKDRKQIQKNAKTEVMKLAAYYGLDDQDLPDNVQSALAHIIEAEQDPRYWSRRAYEKMQIHCIRVGTPESRHALTAKAQKAESLAKMLTGKGELDKAEQQRERAAMLYEKAKELP